LGLLKLVKVVSQLIMITCTPHSTPVEMITVSV